MSLINSIVDDKDQVEEITLLNAYENDPERRNSYRPILDLKAKGKYGTYYNLEIQIIIQSYYVARALYYWASIYKNQLQTSKIYGALTKTIGIHILHFDTVSNDEDYIHKCQLYFANKAETKIPYRIQALDKLKLYFIELNKFNKNPDQIKDKLDKWLDTLKHADEYSSDEIPLHLEQDTEITKALKARDIIYMTDEEFNSYSDSYKAMVDRDNIEMAFKKEEGLREGREEGLKEGIKKGIKEGMEKGMEKGEKQAKIKMAKSMKASGMSIKDIARVDKFE